MASLAAQMMFAADNGSNRELVFAVAHVSELLTTLKADYYAGRRKAGGCTMKRRRRSHRKRNRQRLAAHACRLKR